MSGNTLGTLFTVTTFGESHGPAIGCVIDGCPPGMALSEADIQHDLDRRRPGTSRHVTQRQEEDKVEILSGVLLLVPRTSRWGAWLIVAQLVVFLTVHVWMVQHAERYPDIPVAALWLRIAIQFVLIAWAAWFTKPAPRRGPVELAG